MLYSAIVYYMLHLPAGLPALPPSHHPAGVREELLRDLHLLAEARVGGHGHFWPTRGSRGLRDQLLSRGPRILFAAGWAATTKGGDSDRNRSVIEPKETEAFT